MQGRGANWGAEEVTIADSLDEPLLAELYQYWSDRRGQRSLPARTDIDPVDIPHLLPHIALTEIVPSSDGKEPRFHYRVAGTQIEERFGCALTNRFLDEIKEGDYLTYIQSLYRQVMTDLAPVYAESSFDAGDSNTLLAKRLMLPLSDDQRSVNMVLSGVLYRDSDPHHRATVLPFQAQFSAARSKAE
jgi:hypothetical protein